MANIKHPKYTGTKNVYSSSKLEHDAGKWLNENDPDRQKKKKTRRKSR